MLHELNATTGVAGGAKGACFSVEATGLTRFPRTCYCFIMLLSTDMIRFVNRHRALAILLAWGRRRWVTAPFTEKGAV